MNTDPDKVPATMEEAVDMLVATLTPADIISIGAAAAAADERGPYMVARQGHPPRELQQLIMSPMHFFGGMTLRNNWSFWEPDTPLQRDCIGKYQIAHADDMSSLLLEWVAHKALGRPFDPVAHCQRYHDHWAEYGMTSVEAGIPNRKKP